MSLAWETLDASQLRSILETDSAAEKMRLLSSFIGVKHYEDNARSAILVDFCYYNLLFCEENELTPEQTSAFFSIMKQVFEHAFETKEDVTLEENYAFFKEKMLAHSVQQPSSGVALFSLAAVKKIADFLTGSFYRHFKAYKFCFSQRQPIQRTERVIIVETPLTPQPLETAQMVE